MWRHCQWKWQQKLLAEENLAEKTNFVTTGRTSLRQMSIQRVGVLTLAKGIHCSSSQEKAEKFEAMSNSLSNGTKIGRLNTLLSIVWQFSTGNSFTMTLLIHPELSTNTEDDNLFNSPWSLSTIWLSAAQFHPRCCNQSCHKFHQQSSGSAPLLDLCSSLVFFHLDHHSPPPCKCSIVVILSPQDSDVNANDINTKQWKTGKIIKVWGPLSYLDWTVWWTCASI